PSPRPLPSFPPRRSSDLDDRALVAATNRKDPERHREHEHARDERARVFGESVVRDPVPGDHLPEQPAVETVRYSGGLPTSLSETDRKSTRLNSSHEWISY